MKRIVVIFICLISFNFANAQLYPKNNIYLNIAFNFGNYNGYDLSLNYVQNENISYQIGHNRHFRKPISQPENYSTGLVNLLFFDLGGAHDQIVNYQFCIGKIIKLKNNGKIRANLSVGLAYTIIAEPVNWQSIDDGIIGPNYTWDYKEDYTASIIINPKIEFLIGDYKGMTISPMLILNKERIFIGIGFGAMIGVFNL